MGNGGHSINLSLSDYYSNEKRYVENKNSYRYIVRVDVYKVVRVVN